MQRQVDIEYIDQGMFTAFVPVSKAGETAFNEMASFTDGTGKVFAGQAKATIQQLRDAGYIVRKHKPVKDTEAALEAIYKEMDELGL